MRPILKTKRKLSLSVNLAIASLFLIGAISFVLSCIYSKIDKKIVVLSFDSSINTPHVSISGGFYSSPVEIQLSCDKKYAVFYTLDGSQPTLESNRYSTSFFIKNRTSEENNLSNIPSSPRWKPPIGNVSKANVLRAICVNSNDKKGEELVQTYFIGLTYTFPVVALTINEADFFGYKNGIYVMGKNYEDKRDYIRKNLPLNLNWWEYPSNYLKRGDNSERVAHIELYDNTGKLGFENRVGVRINGNATRGFAQKSLRICFDGKYGEAKLNYELYGKSYTNNFNSFVLRNSGNDWNKTMFRDAFMQSLMKNYLDIQMCQPSILFINGEYWGIHNITERLDENYLSNKYKMSLDSITILELGGEVFFGKKHDKENFKELLTYIQANDLSMLQYYQHVEGKIDVNSFMDFIIANVYFCNSDWPNNNVKYWRYKASVQDTALGGVRDGRWRWMLFDTDWGFGYTGSESINLNLLEKAKKTGSIGIIFSGLLKNESFRKKFNDRFLFHLEHTFEKKEVIQKINDFQASYSSEISQHIDRWRAIGSFESWVENVEDLRQFALKRPDIQKEQLKSFLNNTK